MMTRRKFLALGAVALPTALGADACLEPINLRVSHLPLRKDGDLRFVHFSDFHYKGNDAYAGRVVRAINDLKPDFVCFTGDLIEDKTFAPAALEFVKQIRAPVFGSPGNHDYWSGADFTEYEKAFVATGGDWLVDRSIVLADGELEIVGMAQVGIHALQEPQAARRLLLLHYPAMADTLGGPRFDLILSGHSHGGQIRLPFYGALALPWGVGPYDLGYFESQGGPLYVSSGIGTYYIPYRFNCRPEITLVTM